MSFRLYQFQSKLPDVPPDSHSIHRFSSKAQEERKRLELRCQNLEEELEEAQNTHMETDDNRKKIILQLETTQSDLGSEREKLVTLEAQRVNLEKMVKDLQLANQELEGNMVKKYKTQIMNLQNRVNQSESQLESETTEKNQLSRMTRKHEKKVKEVMFQVGF